LWNINQNKSKKADFAFIVFAKRKNNSGLQKGITLTQLSTVLRGRCTLAFLAFAAKTVKLLLCMKKKAAVLATEVDLSVDLTLHDFSATLLSQFAEKIMRPYYSGNMSDAVRDLMRKAIGEEAFVLSHVTG
jgi:hypothetical protein